MGLARLAGLQAGHSCPLFAKTAVFEPRRPAVEAQADLDMEKVSASGETTTGEHLWQSHSVADTEGAGAAIGALLDPAPAILLIDGDLGVGKTVLVRGLGAFLGIDRDDVQSPSYTLIHEHEGSRGRLVHVDLYRVDAEEALAIGLDELLAGPGIKAIEWPRRLPFDLPEAARVSIRQHVDGSRRIRLFLPGATGTRTGTRTVLS